MLPLVGSQSNNDEDRLAAELNTSLDNAFRKTAAYASAHVLMLYWEDDDLGVIPEIETLKDFFEAKLFFQTTVLPIPSTRSQATLQSELTTFIYAYGAAKEGLVIIYYAGHGDRNSDEKKAIWSAYVIFLVISGLDTDAVVRKRKGGPTLNWYEVQPAIFAADSDVLLMFDCCYAAQAARGRENRAVEILAASGIKGMTPPPGDYSFTTIAIRVMERMLQAEKKIVIYNLFKRLLQDTGTDEEVYGEPFHLFLVERDGSIVLRPCQDSPSLSSNDRLGPPIALLSLSISLSQQPNTIIIKQLGKWLKASAPRTISAITVEELILRTEHIQAFLARSQTRKLQSTIADDLQTRSQPESLTFHPSGYAGRSPQIDAEGMLEKLRTWNDQVFQSIESNLLLNPEFASDESFTQLAKDGAAKALGLDDGVRLRMLNTVQAQEPADAANLIPPLPRGAVTIKVWPECLKRPGKEERRGIIGHGSFDGTNVMVEYRMYRDMNSQEETANKVKRLVALLEHAPNPAFCLCPFAGYFHEPLRKAFGLVFRITINDTVNDPRHTTLQKELTRLKLVPLGRRLDISIALTRAMASLHAVGWLHKGFFSENIVFFKSKENKQRTEPLEDELSTEQFDLSNPRIFGFDLSRPENAKSDGTREFSSHRLIYTHPSRWGRPTETFSKVHDIYALGVTLLEIGCWRPAWKMDKSGQGFGDVSDEDQVRAALLAVARQQLPHMAGNEFTTAVVTCLDGSLEEYAADDDASKQHKAFGRLVLDRIVKARHGL